MKERVFVLIEEWHGMKRKRKVEDYKIIGVFANESGAMADRNRLLAAAKRMSLKQYIVRIEEHEINAKP